MNLDPNSMYRKQISTDISKFMRPKDECLRTNSNMESEKISETQDNSFEGQCRNKRKIVESDGSEPVGKLHLDGWIADIMESINEPLIVKKDNVSIADICLERNRPRLLISKQNVKESYGYEIDGITYLWAEEALFLMEVGKLDIYIDEAPISIERARSLLLHSQFVESPCSSEEILTCEADEYLAFKYFMQLGFRVRRRERRLPPLPKETGAANEQCEDVIDINLDPEERMEIDGEMKNLASEGTSAKVISQETSKSKSSNTCGIKLVIGSRRGQKRKAENAMEDSDEYSDSVETLSDDDGNDNFLVEDLMTDDLSTDTSITEEDLDYIVAEADSDIEIVEEVITSHGSVGIEEIESERASNIDDEMPGPSSSTWSQEPEPGPSSSRVIVDLVSSDSDSDLEDITNENIWVNFSSVNTFQMKFPSQHLLPENISARSDGKIYTFQRRMEENLKNSQAVVTSPDEMEVEDLAHHDVNKKLEAGTNSKARIVQNGLRKKETEKVICGSWKEWRHSIMTEARDAWNDSLLGAAGSKSENNAAQKLNLWKTDSTSRATRDGSVSSIRVPFDLFKESNKNFSKKKLYKSINPIHHVAVVRTLDPVLSSSELASVLQDLDDNIPLILALVNEAAEVFVLSSDLKPLPSLFG